MKFSKVLSLRGTNPLQCYQLGTGWLEATLLTVPWESGWKGV